MFQEKYENIKNKMSKNINKSKVKKKKEKFRKISNHSCQTA